MSQRTYVSLTFAGPLPILLFEAAPDSGARDNGSSSGWSGGITRRELRHRGRVIPLPGSLKLAHEIRGGARTCRRRRRGRCSRCDCCQRGKRRGTTRTRSRNECRNARFRPGWHRHWEEALRYSKKRTGEWRRRTRTQMADPCVCPEVEAMGSHPMVHEVIGGAPGTQGFGKERRR
jgi:hypothetical protein